MTILTMVKYEWFEEWKDTTVRKRGDQYLQYKMRFAKRLFDWACTIFPKIKDKVGGPGRSRTNCRLQGSCSISRIQKIFICHLPETDVIVSHWVQRKYEKMFSKEVAS